MDRKTRNMINVTPMIPGVEKETAADLIGMYPNGIIRSAHAFHMSGNRFLRFPDDLISSSAEDMRHECIRV